MLMKLDILSFCENMSIKFKFHYNRARITGTLHEDPYTFSTTFRSFLLRMKSISDKSCRETRNTQFMFNTFFFFFFFRKSWHLWDNVEKFSRAGQPTDDNMAHTHCMLGTYGYKCAHSERNTHCFCIATMVARKCLNVTIYVYFQSC